MTDRSYDMTDDGTAQTGSAGSATLDDYLALLKPRVMSLVVFTALIGLIAAPGSIHPVIGFAAILCIAIGAGASASLNMWYDADIDAIMARTRARPIPRGAVQPDDARDLGIVLSGLSVMSMALMVNYLAALLLAITIGFYLFIYTMWLKRSTPQNIVIGGAAGAFPPMIGWIAVTGSLTIEPIILFLIIFIWTPPHFWALALYRAGDYEKVGVPMMPVVAGEVSTRRQIFGYSLLLVPVTLAPVALGFAGVIYGAVASLLCAGLLFVAGQLLMAKEKSEIDRQAARLFKFSIFWLFAIFAVLGVESFFLGTLG